MSDDGASGRGRRMPARSAVAGIGARAALSALLGSAPELLVGGRRYRLSVEAVFRLEEVNGGFVYFLRNAGALERRLQALSAASEPKVLRGGTGPGQGRDN